MDFQKAIPNMSAPIRQSRQIHAIMGLGHRRLHDQLTELFPEARVIRMDVDTTRKKRRSRETFRRLLGVARPIFC